MAFKGFYHCATERTKLDNQQVHQFKDNNDNLGRAKQGQPSLRILGRQQWRRTSNELKSIYNFVAPSQQLDLSFYNALFVQFLSLFCFHCSFSLSCISLSVALFIFLSVGGSWPPFGYESSSLVSCKGSGMFSGRCPAGFLAWFQQGLFKNVLQQGFLGHGFDYAQK